MSSFKEDIFVEEFACRTKMNYYNLILNQIHEESEKAKLENDPDSIVACNQKSALYISKKNKLLSEMAHKQYKFSNYFEITQLINSLIGLLVFPNQEYSDLIEEASKKGIIDTEHDLPTLWGIVNDEQTFICSYRSYSDNTSGVIKRRKLLEEQRSLESKARSLPSCAEKYDLNDKINRIKDDLGLLNQIVIEEFPYQDRTPAVLIRHMRNAIAHNHISVFPLEKDKKISALIFEDIGRKKQIDYKRGQIVYELVDSLKEDDPNYGQFKLVISVDLLEDVFVELCDLVFRLAAESI